MATVPDALLDGIAAQPDEVGVWEVLTDYLLEQDAPGATLARCDLELFRGISNPELLGALSEARAQRPRLPHEPFGGFEALWRCGFVVRLQLSTQQPSPHAEQVLAAPALRGLHHLRFADLSAREGGRALLFELQSARAGPPLAQRLAGLGAAVTPHLRRFSLHLEERLMPLLPRDLSHVLEVLTAGLPKKVERVDLSLSELAVPSLDALGALAARVRQLNLDGTRLAASAEEVRRLVDSAPACRFFLGGTGLSPRAVGPSRAEWLAPGVVASLEQVETGVVIPLSPTAVHDGFESPARPALARFLRRELMGWSHVGGAVLEDGAVLRLDGEAWTFRIAP